jgi:diguanylate cyclase (GGDEF)-like protein/PAS domain S-box-containing protein
MNSKPKTQYPSGAKLSLVGLVMIPLLVFGVTSFGLLSYWAQQNYRQAAPLEAKRLPPKNGDRLIGVLKANLPPQAHREQTLVLSLPQVAQGLGLGFLAAIAALGILKFNPYYRRILAPLKTEKENTNLPDGEVTLLSSEPSAQRAGSMAKPHPHSLENISESLENDQHLTLLARHIPGMLYIFRRRPNGTFHFPFTTAAIQDIYGVSPQQAQKDANLVLDVIHPQDVERVYQTVIDSATNLTPWLCEYRILLPQGREIWVVGRATPRREEDGGIIWYGYINDITQRKQVELALKESEAKLTTIFQTTPAPIWITILETGIWVDVNTSFCELLEYSPAQVLGKSWRELGFWDNLADLNYFWQRLIDQGVIENFEVVIRTASRQPKTVLLSARVQVLQGQECVVGIMKDISARKQIEGFLMAAKERAEKAEAELQQAQIRLEEVNQKLIQLVNTDALTGIANRRCFDLRLQQEWQRLYREQQFLALILVDVDYFKKYNDFYGHPQGDTCLIKIAQTICESVARSTDLVARIGGEEFGIILPNTNILGAKAIAQRVQGAIARLKLPHQRSLIDQHITISLGIIARIPNAETSPSALLAQADQALYQAKEQGRNRAVVFEIL